MGKLYQTALLPAEKDQVTCKLLNWKARFFSACGEEPRFDPVRKAAAYASPDRKATNRAATSSPPIRSSSPSLFFFLYMVVSPPFVTLNAWAAKQINGSFGMERK